MEPLSIGDRDRVVVMTGAGISADSGLATFRGMGGLWEQHSVYDLASPDGFRRDPGLVWRFYSMRRENVLAAHPNAAHHTLVELERRLGPSRFALVTQNVDGLHHRAGNRRILEMHGSLVRTRCSNSGCDLAANPFEDSNLYPDSPPKCELCGELLRPDVVWFGESLDPEVLSQIQSAISQCRLFVAVGTSGVVYPAAALVEVARAADALTVLVNRDPADNTDRFDRFEQGRAAQILPILFSDRCRSE